MTTGFFALWVDEVRTGSPAWPGEHTGSVVPRVVVVCFVTQTFPTLPDFQKQALKFWLVGKTSLTSIQLIHPYGQTSREVLQRVRPKLTDWNIVIIISLSYITSFLQHKNRSITMITIFLNVNIQYLLHFQINVFLIDFAVIIFP